MNFQLIDCNLILSANPYKELYTKFSAGIFERMFGGYGGEFLYRPFEKKLWRWFRSLES